MKPYWHNCDPCNVNYTIIVKMETMEEDTKYAIYSLEYTNTKTKVYREAAMINNFSPL